MAASLVLLIAYHFPPDDAIGGARPWRFYKYLKRLGYDCHVLTAARQGEGAPADIEYVPDPRRIRPGRGVAWQMERISWKFLLRNDLAFGWSASVARAGAAVLNRRRNQDVTIISSAPPLGTHLAAMRIAAHSGCPWIADFRDPVDTVAGDRALLQSAIAPALERRLLARANLILANTDSMQQAWCARYPWLAEKIHVVWNGFDPDDTIQTYRLPQRERRILSHVGELYGGRDIRPILNSAGRLLRSAQLNPEGIVIRQIGAVEPGEMPEAGFLKEAQGEGWLEIREPVPAPEARVMALDSDGLLLIQPHTAVQVPGKLFEYLRMGRPILAYVIRNSPVERILEQAGVPFECVYPEHPPEEMDRRVLRFIAKLDGRPAGPGQWFEDTFEASRQAGTVDKLIRSLGGG